jgi:hypothetical protein
MVIAIALVILSIGILVSILYRVPGLLFAGTLLGIAAMTLFVLVFSGKLISLSIFLALLVGVVMSTMSLFALMQRMKKHTAKNDFVLNSAKKGASKGI